MYNKQTLKDTLPLVLIDPKAANTFMAEAKECLIMLLPTSSKTSSLFKNYFSKFGTHDDYDDLIQSCLTELWKSITEGRITSTERIDGYIAAIARNMTSTERIDGYIAAIARNMLLNLIYLDSKITSPTAASDLDETAASVELEEQLELDPELYEAINNFHLEVKKWQENQEVSQFSKDYCFINSYQSIKDAAEKTGIASSSISRCVRHERKSAGGFIWLYSSDKICELMNYEN